MHSLRSPRLLLFSILLVACQTSARSWERWGPFGERVTSLLIRLGQAQQLAQWLPVFATGVLIWHEAPRAHDPELDEDSDRYGWRRLALGAPRSEEIQERRESEALMSPPSDAPFITREDLRALKLPKLETRLAYDEARITLRFVVRALSRGERVFWRGPLTEGGSRLMRLK